MNKKLFNKILNELKDSIEEFWGDTQFAEVDTSGFRYPEDEQYVIEKNAGKDTDWLLKVDYCRSNEEGKVLPTIDRNANFYFSYTTPNGDDVQRWIYAIPNATEYTEDSTITLKTTVRVGNYVVAQFDKVVDTNRDNVYQKWSLGHDFYNAIFRY